MFAIAVSSEAIASAVKIAAAAHFRRSGGRPLVAAGLFTEIVSVDIFVGISRPSRCSPDTGRPAGSRLHDAYARSRAGEHWSAAAALCGRLEVAPVRARVHIL
jgi:hypothetical protein